MMLPVVRPRPKVTVRYHTGPCRHREHTCTPGCHKSHNARPRIPAESRREAEPTWPILAGDGATPIRRDDVVRYLPSFKCKPTSEKGNLQQIRIWQVRISPYPADSEGNLVAMRSSCANGGSCWKRPRLLPLLPRDDVFTGSS